MKKYYFTIQLNNKLKSGEDNVRFTMAWKFHSREVSSNKEDYLREGGLTSLCQGNVVVEVVVIS